MPVNSKSKGKRNAYSRNESASGKRRLDIREIRGKYAWIPYSSEDFNKDKRREIVLEDRA